MLAYRQSAIDILEFRIEIWDPGGNRIEELLALCSDPLVARGAYEATIKLRPGANHVLSHRTPVKGRARR